MLFPDLDEDASAFRAAIERTLRDFVDEQATRLEPLGQDAMRLVDAARTSVTGGKRLRASFCYWGFHAADPVAESVPQPERAVLRASAALELLHASALVHDDYIDASETRRGRPAVHRSFEMLHRAQSWSGGAERYGGAAAILLGDLLLTWSDELLRTCGFEYDVVGDALTYFDHTRSEVIAGQFLDVSLQAQSHTSVEASMKVLRFKSAKYSVERPLHIGAALAGADDKVQSALSDIGLPLGEAFQLRDDLLGVFGDAEVTGKPTGDDLVEGKRTVLVALAAARADAANASRLEQLLGTELSSEQIVEAQEIIRGCGALDVVEDMISELTETSLRALDEAPMSDTAKRALRALAAASTQRNV